MVFDVRVKIPGRERMSRGRRGDDDVDDSGHRELFLFSFPFEENFTPSLAWLHRRTSEGIPIHTIVLAVRPSVCPATL